jgi:signal transduction histidine kinase/HPt (histidine-containing phosphotransfer) domain-containing protein/HAMP domain-containing protein
MHIQRFFVKSTLATKIVMLVCLMGVITAVIVAYTVASIRGIDRQYQSLITKEAMSALLINDAALDLNDSIQRVYAALTERKATTSKEMRADLLALQSQFNDRISEIRRLSPEKSEVLDAIGVQSTSVFALAARVVDAVVLGRSEQALRVIHEEFEPELAKLRRHLGVILAGSNYEFESSANALTRATETTTLTTAIAVSIGLALVIVLAGYFAITRISLPLTHLASVMRRLSQRNYDDVIVGTHRRDEVATMATTLQLFKDTMQRADELAAEVAATAAAQRLSDQLEELASGIPGAVFQFHADADGHREFSFLSQRSARLGLTVEGLNGLEAPVKNNLAESPASEDDTFRNLIATSVQTLAPLDFDMTVQHEGRVLWLRTMATARRAPDGGAIFNGAAFDVTQVKEQAKALVQAKQTAEVTAQEKVEFLATMSHEIRTPLNAILGMAQLALKTDLTPLQRQRLEQTCRSCDHLQRIIDHILDLSKLESGNLALEIMDFDVDEVLADAVQMCQESAEAKGLRLKAERHASVPPMLVGDPFRIRQILVSYTSNAIQFTQDGEVSIRVALEEDANANGLQLRFEVQDMGRGLTAEQVSGLFLPFRQAGSFSLQGSGGGTGLGLAISRQLAQLMGGHADVQSEPGKGSCFWFTVRVQPSTMAASTQQPGAQQPGAGDSMDPADKFKGRRILVVEDNELNQIVASGLLEAGGMVVDVADNGRIAIDMLTRAPDGYYAAVLMDMQMPEMDGLTATGVLRDMARFDDLPIIAMTANATREDVQRTRRAGMDAHISKPISEAKLWEILGRWVTLPKSPVVAAKAEVAPPSIEAFDPAPIEELRQVFTPADLQALVSRFVTLCEGRMVVLTQASEAGDWARLATEAHDLGGTAGSFGLHGLTTLGRALEEAARTQNSARVAPLLAQIRTALAEGLPRVQALSMGAAGGSAKPG